MNQSTRETFITLIQRYVGPRGQEVLSPDILWEMSEMDRQGISVERRIQILKSRLTTAKARLENISA